MTQQPRLKDIARLAYVSEATVSRVINNRRGVSPEVRRRVQVAMQTLGFRLSRHGLVGLIIPDRTNYFVDLGLIFGDRLSQLELQVITASTDGSEPRELDLVNQFVSIGLRAVVYIAAGEPRLPVLQALDRAEMPTVVFDRKRLDDDDHDAVCTDNVDGMRRAVDYLVARGHERIGYLGGREGTPTAIEREAGFRQALEHHHLVVQRGWMWPGNYRPGSGLRCADHLLHDCDDPPSAIVCANDLMAIGLMHRLQEGGWLLPEQLSVIGFDNIDAGRWCSPALTSVDQKVHELVDATVGLLSDRMRDGPAADGKPPRSRQLDRQAGADPTPLRGCPDSQTRTDPTRRIEGDDDLMSRVYVIGSINVDLVAFSPRHPRIGETVMGQDLHLLPGGKGANQAVAAKRAGADTALVGRVRRRCVRRRAPELSDR